MNSSSKSDFTNRGFSAIGLINVKCDANFGGALRAAGCYGASFVAVAGSRMRRTITDTQKYWKHNPVLVFDDIFDACPYDCVPIGIEFIDGATSLINYRHPERAFYIFGPEDGNIPNKVLTRCKDVVMIPTISCMNLAATVNVVLYDRFSKYYSEEVL